MLGYLTAVTNLSKEENVVNLMLWKTSNMLQTLRILLFRTILNRRNPLKTRDLLHTTWLNSCKSGQ